MDQTNLKKTPINPTWQDTIRQISTLLFPIKQALVIIPSSFDFDVLASAVALSLSLKKVGRESEIVSPVSFDSQKILAPLGEEKNQLPEIFFHSLSQITTSLKSKKLLLTINFQEGTFSEGHLEKGDQGLILTLAPEKDAPPIEPLNINTQVVETKPEATFTLSLRNLYDLGEFYQENQSFFQNTNLINIDNQKGNLSFGKANLIDFQASSLSEMTTLMLYDLRFVIDPEIAKILYLGIKFKTENFSPKYFSANMLEASSIALRYQQPVKNF